MRALVVYESIFGNTREVADAIGEGIAGAVSVDTLEVSNAPVTLPGDVLLLVVGGPTHAHGLASTRTREDAIRRAGDRAISRGMGISEWLDALDLARRGVIAAAFDTRIKGPSLLWGSAARPIAQRLRHLGFELADAPRSFLVDGPTGSPFDRLVAGELARARSWGVEIASRLRVPAGVP